MYINYIPCLIAGAANTISHGSVWINSNHEKEIFCYALHNLIAIVDMKAKVIKCTLKAHSMPITALSYCVSEKLQKIFLFSVSSDKSVQIWSQDFNESIDSWKRHESKLTMKGSINSISTLYFKEYILLSCADSLGNIAFWRIQLNEKDDFQKLQDMKLPPSQMAHNVLLSFLPFEDKEQDIALFIGGLDSKIHIAVANIEKVINSNQADILPFQLIGSLSGHQEWITTMHGYMPNNNSLFLASGSQDSKIRIWKIKQSKSSDEILFDSNTNDKALEQDDINEEEDILSSDYNKNDKIVYDNDDDESEVRLHFFSENGSCRYSIFLESLLIGHEDWVTSVRWMPLENSLRLFSTSMDRNMVIWSPSNSKFSDIGESGIWNPTVRVGDIGGALGGHVGGNLLGFVGGCVSPDLKSVIGIGYGGSFHLWSADIDNTSNERWHPIPFISGHFESVNDISWAKNNKLDSNQFLLSASTDQTCRIFAPILSKPSQSDGSWKEISRPQIHGYNMNCIVQSPLDGSNIIFTAGEEKLIRVFDVPNIIVKGMQKLCGIELNSSSSSRVEKAFIPELGLSNKAIDTMTSEEKKDQEARAVENISWEVPPLEGQLADHTLWPEIKKLFGHTNEIVSMCLSPCGLYLASSSKARDSKTAKIIIWDTRNMQLNQKISGHESTIVCLRFSPDSRFLISSGKDRALGIACQTLDESGQLTYRTSLFAKSIHKRIVWDACWVSNTTFATVSRDGSCKIWGILEDDSNDIKLNPIFSFQPFDGKSVNSIDCKLLNENYFLLVLGSELGSIRIVKFSQKYENTSLIISVEWHYEIPSKFSHGTSVSKIQIKNETDISSMMFASCGEDHTVRVHQTRIIG